MIIFLMAESRTRKQVVHRDACAGFKHAKSFWLCDTHVLIRYEANRKIGEHDSCIRVA